MTAVEFLAEKYDCIICMRKKGEISANEANKYFSKFLQEAKDMEIRQIFKDWENGFPKASLDLTSNFNKKQ